MKVYLEKRGCDVHPESELGRRAVSLGITNHRYFTELPGRNEKEKTVYMEFTFHDWSTSRYDRKHMQTLGRDPDKINIHVDQSYCDLNGQTWGIVKKYRFFDGEAGIKSIEQYIRRHGYPNAEVEVKEA